MEFLYRQYIDPAGKLYPANDWDIFCSVDVQHNCNDNWGLPFTISFKFDDQEVLLGYVRLLQEHNVPINDLRSKEMTHQAIEELHADTIRIVMLTGDNQTTAKAAFGKLGIDDFMADGPPADKTAFVKRYQKEGRIVAMSGDGISDAPALAQTQVGIATGCCVILR